MKRVLTLLVTMGLATAGLVGLAPAQATLVESQASPPAAASLLFTQYADSAKVERIRGKRWKVILNDVDPKTLWFTDRPVREAGRMGTASFVRQWTSYGFTALPPNAVIQHSTSEGATVALKNPRYDRETRTLVYTAILDPGSGQRLARSMTDVSIFIDNSGMTMTSVTFQVNNMQPGQTLTIDLTETSGEPDPVYASFYVTGPTYPYPKPLINTENEPITLESFSVEGTQISMSTTFGGGDPALFFTLSMVIMTPPTVSIIGLKSSGDPGIEVQAAVGDQIPQVVNQSTTLFTLNPA